MTAKNKKREINLIPEEEFQSSFWGKTIKWALTTFRIMVIVTELVVMGAFLSRFWLDAKNSDLNENLDSLKSQLEAYQKTENEFRDLQKRISILKSLYSEKKQSSYFKIISESMPQSTALNSISITEKIIQLKMSSMLEKDIIQLMNNLESTKEFSKITLGQTSSNTDNEAMIDFTIDMEPTGKEEEK